MIPKKSEENKLKRLPDDIVGIDKTKRRAEIFYTHVDSTMGKLLMFLPYIKNWQTHETANIKPLGKLVPFSQISIGFFTLPGRNCTS